MPTNGKYLLFCAESHLSQWAIVPRINSSVEERRINFILRGGKSLRLEVVKVGGQSRQGVPALWFS